MTNSSLSTYNKHAVKPSPDSSSEHEVSQNAVIRQAHYVLSSHWDREWYQPFQDFRYRLVQLLDEVLQGADSGELKGPFQADGQAIMIEDYLEVRPDKRAQIEALAKSGRLIIGPWYVLPDEFLVSGESLIRNLKLGRAIARQFGGVPSKAGFACDLFGHVSQLPQIFAGFGIHAGLIWRGTNNKDARLVRWVGADGSEMLCYRFGPYGYCNYANGVRRAGNPQAFASSQVVDLEPQQFTEDLKAMLRVEDKLVPEGPLLLFDGGDHQYWDRGAYRLISECLNQPISIGSERFTQIQHSSLELYLSELLSEAPSVDVVVHGELREPALHRVDEDMQWLITGVLSSRVDLKQVNAACETALTQWAEPMSLLATKLTGAEYPNGFLDIAWRWLLKNHPHDSICGCSIDQVHEDMKFRFSQCSQISDRLTTEALRTIAHRIPSDLDDNSFRIVVFNASTQPITQTTELTIALPLDWPTYPTHGSITNEYMFEVLDHERRLVAFQQIRQRLNQAKVDLHPTRMPRTYKTNDVTISLPVDIPAMGYTTFTIRKREQTQHERMPMQRGMLTGVRSMANAYLEVTIENNGTLTVTDKQTGQTYRDLLTFESAADQGDGWMFGQTVGNQAFLSSSCHANVALIADGPMQTTFRVQVPMQVPSHYCDGNTQKRSDELVSVFIDSSITLRPDAKHLEIDTVIDNQARDHRMRLLLPTQAHATTYLADSAFDVIERPIALRPDNHLYREPEIETKPQQSWTAVADDNRGMAVIAPGQYESAVLDRDDQAIALTLFRSTSKTVMTSGEPGGQLTGKLRFRYIIAPLQGSPNRAGLTRLAQQFAATLRSVQMNPIDYAGKQPNMKALPHRAGFLQVDGDVVVTACGMSNNVMELRLFNPDQTTTNATVRCLDAQWTPQHAIPVDFESNPSGSAIPFINNEALIEVGPKRIATFQIISND